MTPSLMRAVPRSVRQRYGVQEPTTPGFDADQVPSKPGATNRPTRPPISTPGFDADRPTTKPSTDRPAQTTRPPVMSPVDSRPTSKPPMIGGGFQTPFDDAADEGRRQSFLDRWRGNRAARPSTATMTGGGLQSPPLAEQAKPVGGDGLGEILQAIFGGFGPEVMPSTGGGPMGPGAQIHAQPPLMIGRPASIGGGPTGPGAPLGVGPTGPYFAPRPPYPANRPQAVPRPRPNLGAPGGSPPMNVDPQQISLILRGMGLR